MSTSSRVLAITEETARAIVGRCAAANPREACGVIISGRLGQMVEITNVATGEGNYEFDEDEYKAMLLRLPLDKDVIGIWHSHPRGPSQPSPTDIRYAVDPDLFYVIVDLSTTEHLERPQALMRSYYISDGQFTKDEIWML